MVNLKKVFLIAGIILLIIILIGAITVYQIYDIYKTGLIEKDNMEKAVLSLQGGNCSSIQDMEKSLNIISRKTKRMCSNPIIKIAVNKIEKLSLNCTNIEQLNNQALAQLEPIKQICKNMTLSSQ